MWKFTASRADFYLWAVSELMSLLMVFLLLPRSMECLVTITENETDFYATLQDIHRNKCTHVHSGMMLVYCFVFILLGAKNVSVLAPFLFWNTLL